MPKSRVSNVANMSFNAIGEKKFSQKFLNLQYGEMPFSVAVHLDLHCQSTLLGVSSTQMLYPKRCKAI